MKKTLIGLLAGFILALPALFFLRYVFTFEGEYFCVIRAMPITESGASRSPIPAHGDHPIRAMPITGQA